MGNKVKSECRNIDSKPFLDETEKFLQTFQPPKSIILVDLNYEGSSHSQIYLNYSYFSLLLCYSINGLESQIIENGKINYNQYIHWTTFSVKKNAKHKSLGSKISKFIEKTFDEKTHNSFNFCDLILRTLANEYKSPIQDVILQYASLNIAAGSIVQAMIWRNDRRQVDIVGLSKMHMIKTKQMQVIPQ